MNDRRRQMRCSNCGETLSKGTAFCSRCAMATNKADAAINQAAEVAFYGAPPSVGFSPKIDDPAFAKYKRKSGAWSIVIALILAVIAIIGFPLYGQISGEIEWPGSLLYGIGLGGLFIFIALIQLFKRMLDKTWDGTIEYKDSYERRERDQGAVSVKTHTYYVLKVRKDSGGVKKNKWRDIPGPYHYYNIGDRVRHHKGCYYYEKYDKSGDGQILCAACMTFHPISLDVCPKCKCPLLK